MPKISALVRSVYRIIITISKTVIADNPLPSAGISICVDESTPARIIIPALEVIQLSLYGVYLAVRAKMGKPEMEGVGTIAAIF